MSTEIPDFVRNAKYRVPIIDKEKYEEIPFQKAGLVWDGITTEVLRELPENENLRGVVKQYLSYPLSESLPLAFISDISARADNQGRLARFLNNYGRSEVLHNFLSLLPIPDQILGPDIKTTPGTYGNPEKYWEKSLDEYVRSRERRNKPVEIEKFKAEKEKFYTGNTFAKGITQYERAMITARYNFAREVKFLSIASELLDTNLTGQEEINMNGCHVEINPAYSRMIYESGLLDPRRWSNFVNIQDRVRTLRVEDRDFVIKEEKTNRHVNTKEKGHKPGLKAKEEYLAARELSEKAGYHQDGINVQFEKPLAVFEAGDYNFTVFEQVKESDHLVAVQEGLERGILENQEKYSQEFEEMKKAAGLYKMDAIKAINRGRSMFVRAGNLILHKNDQLSFEEFAKVKSWFMIQKAMSEVINQRFKLRYINGDNDNYMVSVGQGENGVVLNLTSIDLEYYHKADDKEYEQFAKKIGKKKESIFNSRYEGWGYPGLVGGHSDTLGLVEGSVSEHAYYIALMEKDGGNILIDSSQLVDLAAPYIPHSVREYTGYLSHGRQVRMYDITSH